MTAVLESHAGEVVTHSPAHDVALSGGAGTLVLITLDNGLDHTRPTILGPAGLRALDAALESALGRSDVAAIAVTGKPYFFCVGADLKGVGQLRDAAQARAIAELGHAVFSRLRTAAVPTFAFVNGAMMGGGTELALSCDFRSISASVPAVALPEVFLGIIPGWGGATLVPRLLGVDAAIRLIIENPLATNRMLRAADAYDLGLADVVLEPADFLEQSLRWAADVVRGDVVVDRALPDLDPDRWAAGVDRARAFVDAKLHGAAPAAYRALDLIAGARTRTVDEGFAAEEDALTELIMSEEFRSSVYAFDLVQRRAKRPVGAPDRSLARPVTKVGIVGAGLMAGQLALLFARRLLVPVVMTDVDQERVDRGVRNVHGEIDELLAKGRLSADAANRLRGLLTGAVGTAEFADADFVIEAVFEDLDVKKQVLSELEAVVRPECVLATNTSSLSVTEMATGLQHPERVVGFHFFNPVAVMPLLEVVRGQATDDVSLATAFDVARTLKKSSVLVADAPGFVVNRLLTRFLGEVAAAVDAGTPIEVVDAALAPLGLPMAPFVLLDLVGPAIALHTAETLSRAFPDRFRVSSTLEGLVAAGKRRVWLRGADGSAYVDPEVVAMVAAGPGPARSGADVLRRTVRALAEEARLMLDEGVVAAPEDLDMCMLLGAGWPFHLGGLTPYLDRSGVAENVTGRRFLVPGVASLPAEETDTGSGALDTGALDAAAGGTGATEPVAEPAAGARTDALPAPVAPAAASSPANSSPGASGGELDLPAEALAVTSGRLSPRGMTLALKLGGEVRVTFAMPLPVAQIAMFAGRPLPVPPSMFSATLLALGAEVPVEVSRVSVVGAAGGSAELELVGTVRFSAAGLPYADREVTLLPTVSIEA